MNSDLSILIDALKKGTYSLQEADDIISSINKLDKDLNYLKNLDELVKFETGYISKHLYEQYTLQPNNIKIEE